MALARSDILAHPRLRDAVTLQSQALLAIKRTTPKLASIMATRQRWYMVHAAAAACFRSSDVETGRGLLVQTLVDFVVQQNIASRNTAAAFYRECLRYGMLEHTPGSEGKRYRPVNPTKAALEGMLNWVLIHLATLDHVDGGSRTDALRGNGEKLALVHPVIADGLLAAPRIRQPGPIYDMFAWVNEGGLIMDRLIFGMQSDHGDGDRILVDVHSVSSLAAGINLSRTHLGRTLATAERLGCLGWTDVKGRSQLWISAQFRRDYYEAQAEKLAVVDAACEAVLSKTQAGHRRMAV